MGFRKPDLRPAWREIARSLAEVASPYNEGWTASACKKDLYMLKCWFNEAYNRLPKFSDESEWDKERVWQRLKDSE
jgi:hypothetical protein